MKNDPPPHLPLGRKAYGSIPHLPGSRTGPGDHHLPVELARVCTEKLSHPKQVVLVQEKLDGSCVCVARIGDDIVALGREGRLASASPNLARQLFAAWVALHRSRFLKVLVDGERLVGEWLALAHSTRYALSHEPFVAFDLIRGPARACWAELSARCARGDFVTPGLVHQGAPIDPTEALTKLGRGHHGALDPVEGAVWRLERLDGNEAGGSRVELVTKFVRHDKQDGRYLPEVSGKDPIWNWHPDEGRVTHELNTPQIGAGA